VADILIGKGDSQVHLLGKFGNRHGLIAGATGTGKSVSLMVLAEGFSRMGVPVFLADVKGDLAGLCQVGTASEKLHARVAQIGIESYQNEANPVVFWDLYGALGHPVRTTVSEMGPALLSRVLELNDTQAGVLDIVFRLADEEGLLLIDLDDSARPARLHRGAPRRGLRQARPGQRAEHRRDPASVAAFGK
jgi:DNA helicase HerA-like ATPase